jgi:heat shock protein HslJ
VRPGVAPFLLAVVAVLVAGCGAEDVSSAGAPSLEGVPWVLTAGIDVEGWHETPPSVSFGPRRMGGWTGCNEYGGPYVPELLT